jgi:hypothetical protein
MIQSDRVSTIISRGEDVIYLTDCFLATEFNTRMLFIEEISG